MEPGAISHDPLSFGSLSQRITNCNHKSQIVNSANEAEDSQYAAELKNIEPTTGCLYL